MTLTTTGYGDILPVHAAARSLANLEALIGQLYPADPAGAAGVAGTDLGTQDTETARASIRRTVAHRL